MSFSVPCTERRSFIDKRRLSSLLITHPSGNRANCPAGRFFHNKAAASRRGRLRVRKYRGVACAKYRKSRAKNARTVSLSRGRRTRVSACKLSRGRNRAALLKKRGARTVGIGARRGRPGQEADSRGGLGPLTHSNRAAAGVPSPWARTWGGTAREKEERRGEG